MSSTSWGRFASKSACSAAFLSSFKASLGRSAGGTSGSYRKLRRTAGTCASDDGEPPGADTSGREHATQIAIVTRRVVERNLSSIEFKFHRDWPASVRGTCL